ncbi:MAG: rhodanese-like domain-containing protein [Myxococcota bacterium]|nr:rhodanese-like domain-containing protein [Myxococcota bacterium]
MADRQSDWDIGVEDLKQLRDAGDDFFLLDVREPHEVERATLGGTNIPLAGVAAALDDIPKDRKIVVHCKLGGRSAKAVTALRQLGYDDVWNVQGGIQAWSERIDSSLPTY